MWWFNFKVLLLSRVQFKLWNKSSNLKQAKYETWAISLFSRRISPFCCLFCFQCQIFRYFWGRLIIFSGPIIAWSGWKYVPTSFNFNFSFLAVTWQLYRFPCHWLTDSLTHWLTDSLFWKTLPKSTLRNLWPLRHVIRVMRRHDLTNKKTMTMTKTNTKTMTMLGNTLK